MNIRKIATIVAAALTVSSASVLAGGYVDTVHQHLPVSFCRPYGWYLSLNGGATVVGDVTKSGRRHSGFVGGAGTAYFGYQYDKTWAAEIGAAYYSMFFGSFDLFNIGVKATLPLGERGSLFAKLGGGAVTLKACFNGCQTQTKGGPTFGAGFGYYLSTTLMATIEYDAIYVAEGNSNGSLGGVTAGLTYFFKNSDHGSYVPANAPRPDEFIN